MRLLLFNGYSAFVEDDEEVLLINIGGGYTHCEGFNVTELYTCGSNDKYYLCIFYHNNKRTEFKF